MTTGAETTGAVKVLLVSVSVVALPTKVSVAAGSVNVTSAVAAGPIKVTELVPLSVSSLNKILPAALLVPDNTGAESSGAVSVLLVNA